MSGSLKVTTSEQGYGYLYLGVKSKFNEDFHSPVTVIYGSKVAYTYVHNSNKYRIDGLTDILANLPIGAVLNWTWHPKHHVLELR